METQQNVPKPLLRDISEALERIQKAENELKHLKQWYNDSKENKNENRVAFYNTKETIQEIRILK